MKGGDTFRPADGSVDKFVHLCAILSDPDQDPSEVLIVSLTEAHPKKDTACILQPGDHPALYKPTCVAYDLANTPSLSDLTQARDAGELISAQPMDPAILDRMPKRSSLSTKMLPEHWDILDRQGLT